MIRCESSGHEFPHRRAATRFDRKHDARRLARTNEDVAVSAIVWAEFLCGPVDAEDIATATEIFGEAVPFDGNAATAAASLFNAGKRRRGSLADCMIAGAALVGGARLATNNRADFERFREHGLVLEGV